MPAVDFKKIFTDLFGYNPPPPPPEIQDAPDRLEESTATGQPYYDEDIFGREFFLPVRLDDQLIPFAVLGQTWKRTIVETPMPERGGSVIEMISIDNYQFNLKGILISPDNKFPEGGIIDIKRMWVKNASVTMRSVISDLVLSGRSNIKGDDPYGHRVVIKEIKWPPVSGVEHAKAFEMELISDLIFDLEIE